VGKACSMHGERRNSTGFWWECLKGKDHLEDQGVNGRMGLEWILGRLARGGVVLDWITLVQDRDKWQSIVNTVMILWVLALWS
jgi:hypothetical protein